MSKGSHRPFKQSGLGRSASWNTDCRQKRLVLL